MPNSILYAIVSFLIPLFGFIATVLDGLRTRKSLVVRSNILLVTPVPPEFETTFNFLREVILYVMATHRGQVDPTLLTLVCRLPTCVRAAKGSPYRDP